MAILAGGGSRSLPPSLRPHDPISISDPSRFGLRSTVVVLDKEKNMPVKQQRSGAANAEAGDLVAVAKDPAAYDKLIKQIVAARESSHDRERRAQAAEASLEAEKTALAAATEAFQRDITQARKELDAREAAVAAKEAELEPREARIAAFQRQINAA